MTYRVVRSIAYNDRWVVQGWFRDSGVWADIGDPLETELQAYNRRAQLEAAE